MLQPQIQAVSLVCTYIHMLLLSNVARIVNEYDYQEDGCHNSRLDLCVSGVSYQCI